MTHSIDFIKSCSLQPEIVALFPVASTLSGRLGFWKLLFLFPSLLAVT